MAAGLGPHLSEGQGPGLSHSSAPTASVYQQCLFLWPQDGCPRSSRHILIEKNMTQVEGSPHSLPFTERKIYKANLITPEPEWVI